AGGVGGGGVGKRAGRLRRASGSHSHRIPPSPPETRVRPSADRARAETPKLSCPGRPASSRRVATSQNRTSSPSPMASSHMTEEVRKVRATSGPWGFPSEILFALPVIRVWPSGENSRLVTGRSGWPAGLRPVHRTVSQRGIGPFPLLTASAVPSDEKPTARIRSLFHLKRCFSRRARTSQTLRKPFQAAAASVAPSGEKATELTNGTPGAVSYSFPGTGSSPSALPP